MKEKIVRFYTSLPALPAFAAALRAAPESPGFGAANEDSDKVEALLNQH